MQISSLQIDRFGVWNDLSLDAFQEGLNVVYGPNGSGKTTVVQFIRSMLYGFTDDVRERYIPEGTRGAGGVLTVLGKSGRRALHRYDDSRHLERLVVKGDDGRIIAEQDLRTVTDGVPVETFDRVFSVSFLHGAKIDELVDAAIGRGFDVLGGDGDLMQLRELREQLQQKRRSLKELSQSDSSLQSLRDRRQSLVHEIEALGTSLRRKQDDWDRQISGSTETIRELELRLERLQRELVEVESTLEAHRAERLRLQQDLDDSRLRYEQNNEKWRSRLAEIEAQRDRWQSTLEEIAHRRRCVGLGEDRLAGAVPLELSASTGDRHWMEPTQLHDCEEQLRMAIAGLMREHDGLLAKLSDSATSGREPGHAHYCTCHYHREQADSLSEATYGGVDEMLAALDAKIQPLERRRQEVLVETESLRGELTEQRRRCQQWKQGREQADCQLLIDLRRDLADVDKCLRDVEERRQLEMAISQLEKDIQLAEQSVREPAVLREASEFLRRLTRSQLHHISVTRQRKVQVRTRAGERIAHKQLSRGNRDQVYLSLCLALVRAYARDGIRFPLVLNDAFVNIDAEGAKAAAVLLRDFVREGHQVLLLTRHQHIADLYLAMNVPVRELPRYADKNAPKSKQADRISDTKRREVNDQLNAIAQESLDDDESTRYHCWSAEEFPGELTDRVRLDPAADASDGQAPPKVTADFFLHESSPIQDAPSIDAATAERFRKIGVQVVGHLLRLKADDAADRLRYAGITADMIRRWQAEAMLVCRVPRLRPYDARILVACGITSPRRLSEMDTNSLGRRVEEFARTSTGQVLMQSGTQYEIARLIEWIQAARKSRNEPVTGVTGEKGSFARVAPFVATVQQPSATAALRRADAPADHVARPQATSRPRENESSAGIVKMQQPDSNLRFYLSLEAPLVDAPSIGPRTAERFEEIGLNTVAQFLRANPKIAAERLDHRRIDAETIRTWQQQTTLACQIPMVRGHDAQILVACGVTDPESLAGMDPADLWDKVQPFCETSEGRRIIRSGKAPDFEEVYNWIRWAGHARSLKAA